MRLLREMLAKMKQDVVSLLTSNQMLDILAPISIIIWVIIGVTLVVYLCIEVLALSDTATYLISLGFGVAQIVLTIWIFNSYQHSKEKIKKENANLLRTLGKSE